MKGMVLALELRLKQSMNHGVKILVFSLATLWQELLAGLLVMDVEELLANVVAQESQNYASAPAEEETPYSGQLAQNAVKVIVDADVAETQTHVFAPISNV